MIFINNKYTKWYNNIISNAALRTDFGYSENHHILPRSLGGSNAKSNLARLTAREHFVCHRLLTKMTIGTEKKKMLLALLMMCVTSRNQQRHKINSSQYEQIRIQASKANSGINNPMHNRTHLAETKKKISDAVLIANAKHGPRSHTEEAKKKISSSRMGKVLSAEARDKMSKRRKGLPGQDNNSGKHWYNDGIKSYLTKECPANCVPGRLC